LPPTYCRGQMLLSLITIDSGCYSISLPGINLVNGHIRHFPGAGVCLTAATLLCVNNLHIHKAHKEIPPVLRVRLRSVFVSMNGVPDFVGDINIDSLSVSGVGCNRAIAWNKNLDPLVTENLSTNDNIALNPGSVHVTDRPANATHAHFLGLNFCRPFLKSCCVDCNRGCPCVTGFRGSACLVAGVCRIGLRTGGCCGALSG